MLRLTLVRAGIAATVIAVAGCASTANFKLGSTLTERGFVASRDVSLGRVFLWPEGSDRLRPVDIVPPNKFSYTNTNPKNTTISFKREASFAGGVDLTPAQKATLGLEVAKRSSLNTTNVVSSGFTSPRNALIEAIRGDSDRWLTSLEIDEGYPDPETAPLVVFAYDFSQGDKLSLLVDGGANAGVEVPSSTVTKNGAAVKFKIVDASTLEIEKSGSGRVSLFVRMAVFRMSEGPNGPRFTTVTDDVLESLATALASGS